MLINTRIRLHHPKQSNNDIVSHLRESVKGLHRRMLPTFVIADFHFRKVSSREASEFRVEDLDFHRRSIHFFQASRQREVFGDTVQLCSFI